MPTAVPNHVILEILPHLNVGLKFSCLSICCYIRYLEYSAWFPAAAAERCGSLNFCVISGGSMRIPQIIFSISV